LGAGGYRIQVMASSRGYSSEQDFKDDMGNSRKGDKVLCKGFAGRSMKGELSIIPQKVSSSILEICMLKKILFI
jgi:lysyl-tRNA synthetase class II